MSSDRKISGRNYGIPLNLKGLLRNAGALLPGKQQMFAEMMTDTSRSMITVINRDYRYERVNRTFCLTHNSSPDRLIGRKLSDLWGEKSFTDNIRHHIDSCFTGKVVFYQAFFETPAWGKRYYEVVLKPFHDRNDVVTHVIAETFDITDIRLKEQAATDIEWEFRNLETNLPVGFFRMDNEGLLLHVNRAFLKITGMADETEARGRSLGSFYGEEGLFGIHLAHIREKGVISPGRIRLRTPAGEEVICRLNAFTVRDGSGNSVYIDGSVEDFTRETELERKLVQSQKLETIGMLAGGIAHDFNTILTTIYGHCEILLDSAAPSSDEYRHAAGILRAAVRARELTGQMLTFSRHAGQQKIRVSIDAVISELLAFLRTPANDEINISTRAVASGLFVSADPTQLFRVFINLAGNAVQAMEKGGDLTISIDKCTRGGDGKLKPGDYAIITFADTGKGMDEKTASRIFEPFFTSGKANGTGLGLSVVYGIVSELEGDINVSSVLGKGTRVEVFLPILPAEKDQASRTEDRNLPSLLVVPSSGSESRMMVMGLESSGYNVVSADPSDDWTTLASKADIVVIVDSPPEMSAIDFAVTVGRLNIRKDIILVSDPGSWLERGRLLSDVSIRASLFRPVSLREIINAIDNIKEGKQ